MNFDQNLCSELRTQPTELLQSLETAIKETFCELQNI